MTRLQKPISSAGKASAKGIALLLACLSQKPAEEKITRLQTIGKNDWQAILHAATGYGIAPFLFHALGPISRNLSIDPAVWRALREIYLASAARNMRLYGHLLKILRSCNSEGVPVILLKGAHLAEFVYPDPALRPMSDMDLLVEYQNIAKVHRILIQNGYFCAENNPGKIHLSPYWKPKGFKIDLHFNIVAAPVSLRFEVADLWRRAQPASLQGADVWLLNPEDLILHLVAHSCIGHGFNNGLTPFLDICIVTQHYANEIDWDRLCHRAGQWGIDRAVFLMSALTEKLFGLPIPIQISSRVKIDSDTLHIMKEAESLIYQNSNRFASALVARLFDRQGRHMLLTSFWQLVFPPEEIMADPMQRYQSLSRLNVYGNYVRRFISRLKTHGNTIWSALIRDPETVDLLELENKRTHVKDWLSRSGNEKYRY